MADEDKAMVTPTQLEILEQAEQQGELILEQVEPGEQAGQVVSGGLGVTRAILGLSAAMETTLVGADRDTAEPLEEQLVMPFMLKRRGRA